MSIKDIRKNIWVNGTTKNLLSINSAVFNRKVYMRIASDELPHVQLCTEINNENALNANRVKKNWVGRTDLCLIFVRKYLKKVN